MDRMTGAIDREHVGMYYCDACRDDLRMTQNGTVPENPCYRCGAEKWERLTPDERDRFFDEQKNKDATLARVFFCMRTGCNRAAVEWTGEHITTPCVCGSKMFRELIGPKRAEYLKSQRRVVNG